ncbi:methionyl-tRNA formyltransferase [Spiroplasma turonicum]|uniref:Methionyl-tRNA formyltransferase n=1 Tax=Spiroplasma turonicum TaxID=216946 RepID=A0A0K1P6V5_9MOLU|nr:methionyl-tRNA formyltransferase [Spiroplasma turonicum]AKU80028.1 methionyl-tRNA formyltransferase [Spiroplasma turonicum]ALX71030.1 methionyl-tRNA formyltransferase [Spiroplasma turonicum]
MKKIIYCGTPSISVKPLQALIDLGYEIGFIITQPDKALNRQKKIIVSPLKEFALKNNITIYQPNKVIELLDTIINYEPDFLVTCAYGQFIPDKILNLFKNCINVHASLLPLYRGGSPVQYSLMNGDKETGISLMKMIKKMDAGDVYVQSKICINENDDNGVLFDKLSSLAYQIVKNNINQIFNNEIKPKPQDESKVTFAYNLKNEEEKINWNQSSIQVHNFVRALSPTPIAYTFLENERIKIKKTALIKDDEPLIIPLKLFFPGEIVLIDKKGIIVATMNGYIRILELQREGKKMLESSVYYKQQNCFIKPGMVFK